MMKQILMTVSMLTLSMAASAQSGTNSPYSQYGLGTTRHRTPLSTPCRSYSMQVSPDK